MQLTRGQKIALGVTAAAAAVGGGVYWYHRRRRVNLPTIGGAIEGAIKGTRGNYLGGTKGWQGWDDKTSMPDEVAVMEALEVLGYGASGCIVDGKWVQATDCVAALKLFQSDANQVSAWRRAAEAGHHVAVEGYTETPVVLQHLGTGPTLGVDGRAGRATISALSDAIAAASAAAGPCLDAQGRAEPGNVNGCRDAWARAVDYARASNQAMAAA
jgi:hypothetical protein